MPHLRKLSLEDLQLTDSRDLLNRIQDCPIQELSLAFRDESFATAEETICTALLYKVMHRFHRTCPTLRRLDLSFSGIYRELLLHLHALLPTDGSSLEELSVKGDNEGDVCLTSSESTLRWPTVTRLSLKECEIDSWTILRHFPNLQQLDYDVCQVRDYRSLSWHYWPDSLACLSMVVSDRDVASLIRKLQDGEFNVPSLELRCQFEHLRSSVGLLCGLESIKRLSLRSTRYGEEDEGLLLSNAARRSLGEGLRRNQSLEYFCLENVDIGPSDIASLQEHPTLHTLVICRYNHVRYWEPGELARFVRNPAIKELQWTQSETAEDHLNEVCEEVAARTDPFTFDLSDSSLPDVALATLGRMLERKTAATWLKFGNFVHRARLQVLPWQVAPSALTQELWLMTMPWPRVFSRLCATIHMSCHCMPCALRLVSCRLSCKFLNTSS